MITCTWSQTYKQLDAISSIGLTLLVCTLLRTVFLICERYLLLRAYKISLKVDLKINRVLSNKIHPTDLNPARLDDNANIDDDEIEFNVEKMSMKEIISKIFRGDRLYIFLWLTGSLESFLFGVWYYAGPSQN